MGDSLLFEELANFYAKLEGVSSRLSMMEILSDAFKAAHKDEVRAIVYITQGILAPPFESSEFGVAEKIMTEAIAMATACDREQVEVEFRKFGDLGSAAEALVSNHKRAKMHSRKYEVIEIYKNMLAIANTSGSGSKDKKLKMLAEMISSSSPIEARYLVRYPLGILRLGVGDSTIIEALSIAYTGDREFKKHIERAYNISCDLGLVAYELVNLGPNSIENMKVKLFKPVRPALAERLVTPEEILERMGGEAAVEQKYDGFRTQVHMDGGRIKLYSRRLEDTTQMFPDIAKAAIDEADVKSIIFEGEALVYDEAAESFLPFQQTIQRKRKHDIKKKAIELPLHLMVFDVLFLNGEDMLSRPYKDRRRVVEEIFGRGKIIRPTNMKIIRDPKKLEAFFKESISSGLEGIVAKDMNAPYIAGARKFSWIKLKRSYRGELSDTLDLVIVGYFLGRGNRAEFEFGGLLCAVYNPERDVFETVSRIGSGFSEEQMAYLQNSLSKECVKEKPARVDSIIKPDFWVYPMHVVTINADEITRSPTHTCGRSIDSDGIETGYALRFPRLFGEELFREDKKPEDATTTSEIIEMFNLQKKVSLKE